MEYVLVFLPIIPITIIGINISIILIILYLYLPAIHKKFVFSNQKDISEFIIICKGKAYNLGLHELYKYTKQIDETDIIKRIIEVEKYRGNSNANICLNRGFLPYTLFKKWYYQSILSIYKKKYDEYLNERNNISNVI